MLRTKIKPSIFVVKNRQGKKGGREIGWNASQLKFYDLSKESNFDSTPDFVQSELINE